MSGFGLDRGLESRLAWGSECGLQWGVWGSPGGVIVREAGVEYDWEIDVDADPDTDSVPDPGTDPDTAIATEPSSEVSPDVDTESLEALEHEITTLSAHVHAAEYQLLVLIAEFDRRGGWKPGGHPSCAEWLHFRTGIDRGAARERVRAAHALQGLPRVSEAMSRGELSFSKVRALTRLGDTLDEGAEEELVEFARQATAAELEKLVRGWKLLSRADEAELERRRHASRSFSVFPDDDGMYVVRGRLDPEVGALLMRAVEAAGDALHRPGPTWAAAGGQRGPTTTEVTPRQRRADAIGLLAERAMAAGFREEGAMEAGPVEEDGSVEGACGSAAGQLEGDGTETNGQSQQRDIPRIPLSGSRAERYQVILHADGGTLAEGGRSCDGADGHDGGIAGGLAGRETDREPDRSHLEDGIRVSAETSRRLTCDAAVVRVSGSTDAARCGPENRREPGEPLHIGRRTRTIPPALRRALEVRDGGCRFPGCGLRFTEAHHINHWADGGETNLRNLTLLCRHHHRSLHEDGFRVRRLPTGKLRFYDRTGWPLPDCAPPSPTLSARPVESLVARNRANGVDPDGWTASSRYSRGIDIPWEMEARVREALDR